MSRKSREKYKREGRCRNCGAYLASMESATCEKCHRKQRERRAAKASRAMEAGLCAWCEKPKSPERAEKQLCDECNAINTTKIKGRRERLIAEGKCARCMEPNTTRPGHADCQQCVDMTRNRMREAKNRLKRLMRNHGLSPMQLEEMYLSQKGCCSYTGRKLTSHNASVDHIVPKSKGGAVSLDNVQFIIADANYAKSDMRESDFFQLVKDICIHRELLSENELLALLEKTRANKNSPPDITKRKSGAC